MRYPEGSYGSLGDTKVLCNATVEETLPLVEVWAGQKARLITAEYAMLLRSTQVRTQRETLTPKGRTQDQAAGSRRSLRGAKWTWTSWANGKIIVDCDVLRLTVSTASITGAVALALAVKRPENAGKVPPGVLTPGCCSRRGG